MKVGFTGHQNAPEQALVILRTRLREFVESSLGCHGFCSLAAGADQEFAELLLRNGGELHVVIPSQSYEETFGTQDERLRYRRLLQLSGSVTTLPYPRPTEGAFLAAGIVVVERCDILLALWDGEASAGLGGTGDIVAYAQQVGRTTEVLWPEGLER